MKRYKLHEAVAGKRVVVSEVVDAQIYFIKEVHNYNVHLIYYEHGQEFSGKWIDVSCCYHPTDEQINESLMRP
jgi:hypothetical protein